VSDRTGEAREAYVYQRRARSLKLALVLVVCWLVLALLWAVWDASGWIVAILGAATLPGLFDLIRNPAAGFSVDAQTLRWHSGARGGEVAVDRVDHIRLDTRLDLSVRTTIVLDSGRKLRLPFEAMPPHRELEKVLQDRGIRTERHHFSLMQ
jgi:hypothetical protein